MVFLLKLIENKKYIKKEIKLERNGIYFNCQKI